MFCTTLWLMQENIVDETSLSYRMVRMTYHFPFYFALFTA